MVYIPLLDQLQYAANNGADTYSGRRGTTATNPLFGLLYGLGLPNRDGRTIYGDAFNRAINAGQNPFQAYPWLQGAFGSLAFPANGGNDAKPAPSTRKPAASYGPTLLMAPPFAMGADWRETMQNAVDTYPMGFSV